MKGEKMNGTDWKNKEFTMKELCADMPEIVAYETLEHAKEGYQDIQKIFAQAYEKVCAPHSEISPEDLSFYLLALARTAPKIDEEVFDHKMNLVTQYRKVLKKNLSAFESWDPDSVKRVKESIRIACENRMLLREKYEDYIREM